MPKNKVLPIKKINLISFCYSHCGVDDSRDATQLLSYASDLSDDKGPADYCHAHLTCLDVLYVWPFI